MIAFSDKFLGEIKREALREAIKRHLDDKIIDQLLEEDASNREYREEKEKESLEITSPQEMLKGIIPAYGLIRTFNRFKQKYRYNENNSRLEKIKRKEKLCDIVYIYSLAAINIGYISSLVYFIK